MHFNRSGKNGRSIKSSPMNLMMSYTKYRGTLRPFTLSITISCNCANLLNNYASNKCSSKTYAVDQCIGEMLVYVGAEGETKSFHSEDRIVSIEKVHFVLLQYEHHVARSVCLPRHVIRLLVQQSNIVHVHRDGLTARKSTAVPFTHLLHSRLKCAESGLSNIENGIQENIHASHFSTHLIRN